MGRMAVSLLVRILDGQRWKPSTSSSRPAARVPEA
jgi:hypothetical protein